MEELTELFETTEIHDPQEEFQILLREVSLSEADWNVYEMSQTRKRYRRYLININFAYSIMLKNAIEQFLEMTKIPQTSGMSESYKLKKKIDFQIFLIVTGKSMETQTSPMQTGGMCKCNKTKRKRKSLKTGYYYNRWN